MGTSVDCYGFNVFRILHGKYALRRKMSSGEIGLSTDMRNRVLRGIHYDRLEREKIFNKFVERFLKLNAEDPENFSKIVVHFDKTADVRRKTKSSKIVKKLSYRRRKELGLYNLGKRSLKYQQVLPLHKLWKEYMTAFINLEELRQQNWRNNPEDPNFEQVSLKLYRADYHGAIMSVSKSSCPSYVGVSGIVVMETKNCFNLLGCDNLIRRYVYWKMEVVYQIIPKTICMFTFELEEFQFTFFGKNLQVKPAERSAKKIKTVHISDLQL